MMRKNPKNRLVKALIGGIFGILGIFASLTAPVLTSTNVLAVDGAETTVDEGATEGATTEATATEAEATETEAAAAETTEVEAGATCEESLGALGWLVCPATGKISEAVDWLYDKIETVLTINPVEIKDGTPIYEIWKYFRGVTNVVFIIFLLVVIYSQITGVGITNYGIKKTLPKLIVVAILVNLSFLACSVLVDVSNIVGDGLRGVFNSIEMSTLGTTTEAAHVSLGGMFGALAGGTGLAIGAGIIAFETGAIWMLIPTVLGAIVAVATGLITIALRQAVVALLIMISPLAVVAYMLPNTEDLFKKWWKLLLRMLIFYPMFSLLFGASSLAGWAIIASATDGFGLILGIAVQIFPLFFGWSLMKMSGTFLESINTKLRGLMAKPLATNQAWAEQRRENTNLRNLTRPRSEVYMPSLKLRQFLMDRKVARAEDIKEDTDKITLAGKAYKARQNRRRDGSVSREGELDYRKKTEAKTFERIALQNENEISKGLSAVRDGGLARNAKQLERLQDLDTKFIDAADYLFAEKAHTEKIDYDNAVGRDKRMQDAINAHNDAKYGEQYDPITGKRVYKIHDLKDRVQAQGRYDAVKNIMEGDELQAQFAAAAATHDYDTQAKIIMTKFQKYFELNPPTRDDRYRLMEFSRSGKATQNIDAIIAGLRVINQRGDTDIAKSILDDVVAEGLTLGTHASQSVAGYCMFDVGDNDPFLKRFGKYINLETANAYDHNKRQNMNVTFDEYVKGYHMEPDANGELTVQQFAKRPMTVLLEGTSFDKIERTAMSNMNDSIKAAYTTTDADGKKHVDVASWLRKREEVETAIGPQFISSCLKDLSGSEALKSKVTWMTGYSYKQLKDEHGNNILDEHGNAKYGWQGAWEDADAMEGMEGHEDELRKYYQKRTEQYFRDQTPVQILGLRTDFKDPVKEHLSDAWLHDPEHPERLEEYNRKVSEIQAKTYGEGVLLEETQRRRKAEIDALKMSITGQRMRGILSERGKLTQIYTTRRSGAANNSKDWLRDWLDLDNDVAIGLAQQEKRRKQEEAMKKVRAAQEQGLTEEEKLERLQTQMEREQLRNAQAQVADDAAPEGYVPNRTYQEEDMAQISLEIDDIYEDTKGEDVEVFFEESMSYLDRVFGPGSVIAHEFERYYNQYATAEAHDLKEYLQGLLADPDNYPDAQM